MAGEMRPGSSRLFFAMLVVLAIVAGYLAYRWFSSGGVRAVRVLAYRSDPDSRPDYQVNIGERCGDAPFRIPTNGTIRYIWDDSFRAGHRHQGIDIFGGQGQNQTPVAAAYPGYLTRLPDWKSSVIIRIPEDPLQPERQIWTYYTHMADSDGNSFIVPEFPPGTQEMYVEAGTLLGYQGNYSGNPFNPTGIHLHFSIVLDDGKGEFRNELEIQNTLDPSPYLGLPLNANQNKTEIPHCAN
jgi:murein DD-endopeptidase MepM/ murein hydrolase activator NlpD